LTPLRYIRSPKYTKQRFCPAVLNNDANGFLRKTPVNHLNVIKLLKINPNIKEFSSQKTQI
jgi:hypothetical protein